MLFSAHVHPDPVWYQLDPGEGHAVVIVPDASTEDLKTLVRKLYCHGEDVFYTCVPNTPDLLTMPGTPDLFHTAVPQTPLDHPQTEHNDSSGSNIREKQQQLDMIKVRLSSVTSTARIGGHGGEKVSDNCLKNNNFHKL